MAKGDPRVDRVLAATYTWDPRLEPLARLHQDLPEAYALLPAPVRQASADYIYRRQAALGAGFPVGPPTDGAATINRAIRRAAGRLPAEPEDDSQPVEPAVSTGQLLPDGDVGQGARTTIAPAAEDMNQRLRAQLGAGRDQRGLDRNQWDNRVRPDVVQVRHG